MKKKTVPASKKVTEEEVAPPAPEPEAAKAEQMELLSRRDHVKAVVESLLFASDRPLSIARLADLTGVEAPKLAEIIAELAKDYDRIGRSFTLTEIGGGFQLASRAEFSPWIRRLFRAKTLARLTRSSLETLSVLAYRQPVTRAEVESVRGVNIESVLQTLLERRLIRIRGRKDVPGRPLLYETTADFLQYFGLKSLADLPQLKEIGELVAEERALQELLPLDLEELRSDQLGSRALLSLVERRGAERALEPERPRYANGDGPETEGER